MPVKKCQSKGKPGYKCGDSGKCYTYTSGNERSRKNAKRKAILQCRAIDEPISESEWLDAFGELLEPDFWEIVLMAEEIVYRTNVTASFKKEECCD